MNIKNDFRSNDFWSNDLEIQPRRAADDTGYGSQRYKELAQIRIKSEEKKYCFAVKYIRGVCEE
ncbi:CLUMA_CG001297, isoform A [Clunio marinus]|uniref:CLUMA_CG001297, isoform A n=1 Tax=Clunio marinus TaxID=568069 RepID=A0A1J1HHI8_9DIPT|nr:CLUMA_CG001297, isoform A [Clunio marinus]